MADVDRDIDIFVGGFCDRPNEEYKPAKGPVPSVLLLNNGDGIFTAAKQPALKFFGRTSGAVFADFDNDGRLDLFLINWFSGNHCRLMRNMSEPRNWLDIQIIGRTFNRMGIGSQIKVFKAGQLGNNESLLGFQEITTAYGYASGQPAIAHFGLGDAPAVDLHISLPNGQSIKRRNVSAKQRLVIDQPK